LVPRRQRVFAFRLNDSGVPENRFHRVKSECNFT
jgi:hypothetical protein